MKHWKEKEFEEKYSNIVDNIYKSLVPVKEISRSKYSPTMTKELFADKYLGVDTILRLQNGASISIQEKLRNSKVLNTYPPTLCIELINICASNEEATRNGEWFYAVPQLYFVGYVNVLTGNIIEWYLIDTAKLKLMFANKTLEELKKKYLQKNVSPKRATFLAIPINDITKSVILQYKL